MALVNATLTNLSAEGAKPIKVLFNPESYTITTNMLYPDISVPGLKMPLLQFVRGESRLLGLELFLDRSNTGEALTDKLDELRKFVTIDGHSHAPPICRFQWGDIEFDGVMSEYQEKFTMFDESGQILRARVTIKMKSYEPANKQYTGINPQSPDRTKTRTIRAGDRYDTIAAEEYGDPSLWRVLAQANDDERPRLLAPGTLIRIPPL